MKTFKEFQTESYSRIDEGVGKTAWNLLDKASKWTGHCRPRDPRPARHQSSTRPAKNWRSAGRRKQSKIT